MEGQNKSITFDGREIRLTTGLYAPQANGSVMIECGDTSLLVTATKTTKKDASDFLPLICDYEEKLYAAGRIPGGHLEFFLQHIISPHSHILEVENLKHLFLLFLLL